MDWKNKRVLITGAGGFTGRHLIDRLRREASLHIAGSDIPSEPPKGSLDAYYSVDLRDPTATVRLIEDAQPDVVFHLAGLFGDATEEQLWQVNVNGFVNLLAALRCRVRVSSPIRLLSVGSAAELGSQGASRLPVTEEAPCFPESAYGRSKLEATRLALSEPADGPLSIVVARPFNLVGPGLGQQLSLGRFSRQIAAVLRGEQEAVHCGMLDNRRDYVDVRDAVDAYILLAACGRAGQLYNVCSGRSYLLRDLLENLVACTHRSIPIVCDGPRGRLGDLPNIYGSYAKVERELGWRPRIGIEQSIADLVKGELTLSADNVQTEP